MQKCSNITACLQTQTCTAVDNNGMDWTGLPNLMNAIHANLQYFKVLEITLTYVHVRIQNRE